MRRGEIWTAAGGEAYAGKPRPVVVIQDDRFDATKSITICGLSSNPQEADLFRVQIEPSQTNGLRLICRIMVDKIVSVPRHRLRQRIGHLSTGDIQRLNRAIVTFLGLAR